MWPTRDITTADLPCGYNHGWLWVVEKAIKRSDLERKWTVLCVLSIQSSILEDILVMWCSQKSLYFLPHTSLRRPQHWGLHACIFSALAGWGHHLIDSSQVCIVVNRLRFGYGWTVNRLHFLVIVRALDLTSSIPWLLMTWLRKEPGHQQLWYWQILPDYSGFSTTRVNNCINDLEWHEINLHIFYP